MIIVSVVGAVTAKAVWNSIKHKRAWWLKDPKDGDAPKKVTGRSAGADESVYSIAKRGGRHSGFLKQVEGWSATKRDRVHRNLQKRIEEHEGYIDNPVSHVPNWDTLAKRQQDGLIRHWNKEINIWSEQQSIIKAVD